MYKEMICTRYVCMYEDMYKNGIDCESSLLAHQLPQGPLVP